MWTTAYCTREDDKLHNGCVFIGRFRASLHWPWVCGQQNILFSSVPYPVLRFLLAAQPHFNHDGWKCIFIGNRSYNHNRSNVGKHQHNHTQTHNIFRMDAEAIHYYSNVVAVGDQRSETINNRFQELSVWADLFLYKLLHRAAVWKGITRMWDWSWLFDCFIFFVPSTMCCLCLTPDYWLGIPKMFRPLFYFDCRYFDLVFTV